MGVEIESGRIRRQMKKSLDGTGNKERGAGRGRGRAQRVDLAFSELRILSNC